MTVSKEIEIATAGDEGRHDAVAELAVSVVICAFTDERWEDLSDAIASLQRQTVEPAQCILVIDYNEALFFKSRETFQHVHVVPNGHAKGLAGARNTGIEHAWGDVVAFLDDDAAARDTWIEQLVAPYAQEHIVGTGGFACPDWVTGAPAWFPEEFLWVVGCSYRGLPPGLAPIRNPIGAGMSFRRSVFEDVATFDTEMGRVDGVPLGCEETVLGIRVTQHHGEGSIVHAPHAVVDHKVRGTRATPAYLLRRCFAEGISKAAVAQRVGSLDGTSSERRYVLRVLPQGVARGVARFFRGDWAGLLSSGLILAGVASATTGYLIGRVGLSGAISRWLVGRSGTASPVGAEVARS